MLNIKARTLLLTVLCATASLHAAAEGAPAKEALCQACHGKGGAAPITDTYPKISGQNKGYLISALKAYKAGKRSDAMASIMTAQAKMLSDAEIEALAAYYAAQK